MPAHLAKHLYLCRSVLPVASPASLHLHHDVDDDDAAAADDDDDPMMMVGQLKLATAL